MPIRKTTVIDTRESFAHEIISMQFTGIGNLQPTWKLREHGDRCGYFCTATSTLYIHYQLQGGSNTVTILKTILWLQIWSSIDSTHSSK